VIDVPCCCCCQLAAAAAAADVGAKSLVGEMTFFRMQNQQSTWRSNVGRGHEALRAD